MFELSIGNSVKTIFGITKHEPLDEAFNLAKENLITIFRLCSKYIQSSKENKGNYAQLQCSHVNKAIQNATQLLVESIYNLYKSTDITLDRIEEIENLNSVLITSFKYLAKASENPDCFEIFNTISRKFLVDVMLINLILTPKERDLFTENEKEFCDYFHDLCYEQVVFGYQRSRKRSSLIP
jgi:hypothetical protein